MTVLISNQNSYKYRMAVLPLCWITALRSRFKPKKNVNFALAVSSHHEDTDALRAFSIM